MTRAGRGGAAAAALLALALAGACSSATLPPPPPAPVHDAWPGCIAAGGFSGDGFSGPPDAGSVPDDFAVSAAVLCSSQLRLDGGGHELSFDVERTSTAVGPLLDYLQQPSERPTDGPCPAIGVGRPHLYLRDATGRYLAPTIPTDACGLPLGWRAETAAWDAVPYSDRVLRRSLPDPER